MPAAELLVARGIRQLLDSICASFWETAGPCVPRFAASDAGRASCRDLRGSAIGITQLPGPGGGVSGIPAPAAPKFPTLGRGARVPQLPEAVFASFRVSEVPNFRTCEVSTRSEFRLSVAICAAIWEGCDWAYAIS